MFSTVTSAFFSISLTIATPRGDLRLIASERLLALNMWKYHGSSSGFPGRSRRPGSPVFGFSILTTSAPSHASASVQEVPASNWVKSTTRIPARQLRSWLFSFIADSPARAWLTGTPAERRAGSAGGVDRHMGRDSPTAPGSQPGGDSGLRHLRRPLVGPRAARIRPVGNPDLQRSE